MSTFSDYIVFVDESGDHGLTGINPEYPVFVLAFCIFRKEHYVTDIVPALHRFKLRHFGHDQVVLHEREIRRDLGPFQFLKSSLLKGRFLAELTQIICDAEFALVCTVIDKTSLIETYATPLDPYHIALGYGLERVEGYLRHRRQYGTTHVVVERRGKREDADLQTEFEAIRERLDLPLELVYAGKAANAPGLQFADLIARPVGMHVLRPTQSNRAFDALKSKFHCRPVDGRVADYGLKVFPQTKGPDASRRGLVPTENPQSVRAI